MSRETIHWLNRRYRDEFDRAERLQAELDHIKASRLYRLVTWVRQFLRRSTAKPEASATEKRLPSLTLPAPPAPNATVSLIVPFRDRLDLLRTCLRSLRRGTYPIHQTLLVDNGSTSPPMLRFLKKISRRSNVAILDRPEPFNFSRLCNAGAEAATGDFLLFLNNDIEVLDPAWIERMLELANEPGVGIVGATLLYPDRTIQHAGLTLDSNGHWSHMHRGAPMDWPGPDGELSIAREVDAVTGACLMIRTSLFRELGGFDESLPVTMNDVDLCQRVRRAGMKIAITPEARLWHFESLSRGYSRDPSTAVPKTTGRTPGPSTGTRSGPMVPSRSASHAG